MPQENLDTIARQHRFWRLLSEIAPEVRNDLFKRDRPRVWTQAQWDERWARCDLNNPRNHDPHPGALAWCEEWKMPDWCLSLAERALYALPSRQLKAEKFREMDRWRKAASRSFYYFTKPQPFALEVDLWPTGTTFQISTREEIRERIAAAAAKAADAYFDNHVRAFNEFWEWFATEECRKFDRHCAWLILHKWGGKTQGQIAEEASRGRSRPYTDEAISGAIVKLAKRLGFSDASA
jgi:hypothetical protein